MVRPNISGRRPNRDRRNYDEFRETLSTPVPNRTYRNEIELADERTSTLEQVIRYAATVLGLLLAMRFLVSLYTANVANPFVNFFRASTDWIVSPFQTVFGRPASGAGGFLDWPALAALIVVGVITTLLISLMRPRDAY